MKILIALLVTVMGTAAHAGPQTQDCADSKEGVRQILESRFGERNTSYLDGLAGEWGPAKDPKAEGVTIRDGGALSLGGHYIRVCPQGNRRFFFFVKGFMAGGNSGYITINQNGSVKISGGQQEVAKANGTYVRRKAGGNG